MKLIIGCGYLGRRVAECWLTQGEQVLAVTRSPERAREFAKTGIEPLVADITQPDQLEQLQKLSTIETVLHAVGYDRSAGPSMREVYVTGLQNVLAALPESTSRIIHISSTGVYGNFQGAWIDESAECLPDREGGRVCLAAEHLLAAHPLGQRAVILRLAGIYGPGRIPRRAELLAGIELPVPQAGWLNLIHVEDAAQAVLLSEKLQHLPQLILVADGQPVQRGDYFRELASLLSAPAPQFTTPDANSPVSARAASDKRISTVKLRQVLAFQPCYPSYRAGLAAILAAEKVV